jgi:phosphopantothenoylcysteine decarboxylase/phosphopantothenate--cysteine ligase
VIDGITTSLVETAEQMAAVLKHEFVHTDALIMSAAVSDFKVVNAAENKIHKDQISQLSLSTNEDILNSIGQIKKSNQVTVGFAAETESSDKQMIVAARSKIDKKNLDLIYVNDVSNGQIFGSDETSGYILDRSGDVTEIPLISKDTLSDILLDQILVKLG